MLMLRLLDMVWHWLWGRSVTNVGIALILLTTARTIIKIKMWMSVLLNMVLRWLRHMCCMRMHMCVCPVDFNCNPGYCLFELVVELFFAGESGAVHKEMRSHMTSSAELYSLYVHN